MKFRRWLSAVSSAALLTAGVGIAVVAAPSVAGALTPTTLADDGQVGSLRWILEIDAQPGDTVTLSAGATYVLDRCVKDVADDANAQVTAGDGDIYIATNVTIEGNGATIRQTCPGERVLYTESNLAIDGLTITGGTSFGGGGGLRLDDTDDLTFIAKNSSIVGNCTSGSGGGFKMNTSGDVLIIQSTIANNIADDSGGGVSHSHAGDLLLLNSTVSNNAADYAGGVDVRQGDLTTVYSDIVENTVTGVFDNCGIEQVSVESDSSEDAAPEAVVDPANVAIGSEYDWNTFATVVALPQGGVNCAVASVTIASAGYNFADDLTCNFPVGTDMQGTGASFDPKLGALANNGGSTMTRLPLTGSPLINAIPIAACNDGDVIAEQAVVNDQRGEARPQESGCEIGSVELLAPIVPPPPPPIVVTPTFTG